MFLRRQWRKRLLAACLAGLGVFPPCAVDAQVAAPEEQPSYIASGLWVPRETMLLAERETSASTPNARTKPEPEQIPTPPPEPHGREPTAPTPASTGLTLAELERIALDCNPTLVQAAMNIRAVEGAGVQAGLYPNPTVGYKADEVGNERHAGFQGGFIRQEFVTANKLGLARSVAGHGIQRARAFYEAQRMRVLNDVRIQFCNTLVAQKVVEVNERLAGISQQIHQTSEDLQKAKEVALPAVLQSEIEAETAKVNLKTSRNRYWSAWRQLAALVGRPELEPCKLAGNCEELLPPLVWEEVCKCLLTQSPVLSQARARVDQARCELARQQALRVPNIEVSTAVKVDTATDYTVADVEVGIPLPLHNKNQGNILRAQAELIAAEKDVRRIELVLQRELADVYEQYLSARMQAEAYGQRILPSAGKSWEVIRNGYRQGEFDYLTVLAAQRTYFTANLTYLANLQELATRRYMLEGLLLRGGLDEVSSPEPLPE
jgi:cobalt-zinc-cadmium efflux system outer membrane protein